ncbi:hypothetical protein BDR07DRAFT_1358367 [Suillus spraguei]|nr:hypothetical protein BDR07DRAFT_1358367 [Suillus spraguei]
MHVQARIPAALCALHNFSHRYEPSMFDVEYDEDLFGLDCGDGIGELAEGPVDQADRRRDEIANKMWQDYCADRVRRGLPVTSKYCKMSVSQKT